MPHCRRNREIRSSSRWDASEYDDQGHQRLEEVSPPPLFIGLLNGELRTNIPQKLKSTKPNNETNTGVNEGSCGNNPATVRR